jgi:hypothetical protein
MGGDTDRLRELHDSYVWEVNAAVGENRLDLVRQLADDYVDQALRLMTADDPSGCGRWDCTVCARLEQRPSGRSRRRWPRLGWRHAA